MCQNRLGKNWKINVRINVSDYYSKVIQVSVLCGQKYLYTFFCTFWNAHQNCPEPAGNSRRDSYIILKSLLVFVKYPRSRILVRDIQYFFLYYLLETACSARVLEFTSSFIGIWCLQKDWAARSLASRLLGEPVPPLQQWHYLEQEFNVFLVVS